MGRGRLTVGLSATVLAAVAVTSWLAFQQPPTGSASSAALAEAWMQSAAGPQPALRDRVVTEDEYIAALEATRACLGDAGFDTTPLRELPDGMRKDYGVGPGGSDEADLADVWELCRATHQSAVESVWLAQFARPAEELPQLKRELVACLEDNGIANVTPDMADGAIADAIVGQEGDVAAWVCRERFLILAGGVGVRPPD